MNRKYVELAERKKNDPDFAAQCELMEQEAKERKGGRPKKGEKPPETIPEVTRHTRETNTILAHAKGKPRGEKASLQELNPEETGDDCRCRGNHK